MRLQPIDMSTFNYGQQTRESNKITREESALDIFYFCPKMLNMMMIF